MPQIDISTDLLTRLNIVAEKDYQGASLEQTRVPPYLHRRTYRSGARRRLRRANP